MKRTECYLAKKDFNNVINISVAFSVFENRRKGNGQRSKTNGNSKGKAKTDSNGKSKHKNGSSKKSSNAQSRQKDEAKKPSNSKSKSFKSRRGPKKTGMSENLKQKFMWPIEK